MPAESFIVSSSFVTSLTCLPIVVFYFSITLLKQLQVRACSQLILQLVSESLLCLFSERTQSQVGCSEKSFFLLFTEASKFFIDQRNKKQRNDVDLTLSFRHFSTMYYFWYCYSKCVLTKLLLQLSYQKLKSCNNITVVFFQTNGPLH